MNCICKYADKIGIDKKYEGKETVRYAGTDFEGITHYGIQKMQDCGEFEEFGEFKKIVISEEITFYVCPKCKTVQMPDDK